MRIGDCLKPLACALLIGMSVDAQALGLLDAYARAAAHDPALQAAHDSQLAGAQGREIGRAALLPQLSLSYQNVPENEQQLRQRLANGQNEKLEREYSSYAGTVTLTQAVFDASAWARWKQSGAYALMADEQFRDRAQDLALRLLRTYTELLFAQDQLGLAQAQRQAYAEQLDRNRQTYEHGDGTLTDIAETEARLHQAQVQWLNADDAADVARRALQALIGEDTELPSIEPLRSDFASTAAADGAAEPMEFWRSLALQRNAELAAQKQSLEAARQEVRRQRAGHLPTVHLFAQYAQNESEIGAAYDQRYRTTSVGAMLSLPLYSGGSTVASVRQAQYLRDSAEHTLDARMDSVLLELSRQHRLVSSAPQRIAASLKAVEAAELALEGNRRGVLAGERINSDVLDAAQRAYAARRDLARSCYDALNARLALRYRAGVLGESDLRDIAQWFAPSASAVVAVQER